MKFSVRTKLLSGFLVVIALMVVLGVVAISRMGAINDNVKQFGSRVSPALRDIGSLNAYLFIYRFDQMDFIVGQPRDRILAARSMATDLGMVDRYVARLQRTTTGRTNATVDAFKEAWDGYVAATAPFRAFAERNDYGPAIAAVKAGAGRRAYDAAVAQLVAINDQLGRMSTDQSKDAESTVDSGRTAILILLAIGALVGIAIALFVGRLIAGGLQQLVRAARGSPRATCSRGGGQVA